MENGELTYTTASYPHVADNVCHLRFFNFLLSSCYSKCLELFFDSVTKISFGMSLLFLCSYTYVFIFIIYLLFYLAQLLGTSSTVTTMICRILKLVWWELINRGRVIMKSVRQSGLQVWPAYDYHYCYLSLSYCSDVAKLWLTETGVKHIAMWATKKNKEKRKKVISRAFSNAKFS